MRKPNYSWIRRLDRYSPEEREAWIRYFEEYEDYFAPPPENVKGIATEEDLDRLQDNLTSPFREKVRTVLSEIEKLLVAKNEAYGNSALEPINVFSKADAVEQIKVRIDDKISRLHHGKEYGSEDTVTDLIGYLVILKIAEKELNEDNNR